MPGWGKPALLLGLSLASGCGPRGTVVAGPREISANPQEIAFLGPVPVAGPRRELCFDFDPPGESHKAKSLRAVLVTNQGRRDTLLDPRLDRRGESRVCLVAPAPSPAAAAELRGVHYRGVELSSSDPPVRLRAIRWWSGS
jgi:hypothetical protein